jgi:hypothetical protein
LSVEREEGPGGEERDPGPIMRMATGKTPNSGAARIRKCQIER